MTSKLKYLAGVSLKRKIKTKWFVLANLLLALVIIAGCNIDTIITAFGGDFDKKTTIYVIDNKNIAFDLFKSSMENANITSKLEDKESVEQTETQDSNFIIKKYNKTEKEAKKQLEDKNDAIILVFDQNDNSVLNAKMITRDYLSATKFQLINTALNSTKGVLAIQKSNISKEELAKISEPIKIKREYLDKDKNEQGENNEMIMGVVFPVLILPFFMLTLFLVQMIGAEVNDEKTTRGMEIIISNVSPKAHFFSKVIAGNLFVIIQGILLFLYGSLGLVTRALIGGNKLGGVTNEIGSVIGNVIKGGIIDKLIYIIPLTLVLMIITFIAYSLLAGILASMTTNIEDFQQLQTPIIVISLVGYYLAAMSTMFSGSLFIRAFSYVPLISAILAPSLLMIGQIGIIDVLISIVLVIVTNVILIKYGLKIYKVGILNYSSKGLWRKMFKALKE